MQRRVKGRELYAHPFIRCMFPNVTNPTLLEELPVCFVCLEPILQSNTLPHLDCNCEYTNIHQHCLIKWVKMYNTCPICKHDFSLFGMHDEFQQKKYLISLTCLFIVITYFIMRIESAPGTMITNATISQ